MFVDVIFVVFALSLPLPVILKAHLLTRASLPAAVFFTVISSSFVFIVSLLPAGHQVALLLVAQFTKVRKGKVGVISVMMDAVGSALLVKVDLKVSRQGFDAPCHGRGVVWGRDGSVQFFSVVDHLLVTGNVLAGEALVHKIFELLFKVLQKTKARIPLA